MHCMIHSDSMRLRHVILPLVGLLTASTVAVSAHAEEPRPGRFPGLPYMVCDFDTQCAVNPDQANTNGWINGVQQGQTGSVPAKQWANIPIAILGINSQIRNTVPEGYTQDNVYQSRAFMVSPKGSLDNYGDSPLIPVRTVAFGSIPVEATLQVSQQRDADDLPVPIEARSHDRYRDEGLAQVQELFATEIDTNVDIRLRRLVVDGVDTGLDATCRAPRARLKVASEAATFSSADGEHIAQFDQTKNHLGFYGGTLKGTVDIPSFQDCTTRSGDDMSSLVTATLSAQSNPVTVQLGTLECVEFDPVTFALLPPKPGTNTPQEAGCLMGYYNNTPGAEDILNIPKQLPFPSHAPGE